MHVSRKLKAASAPFRAPACMQLDSADDEVSSSASSIFLGGKLPTVWLGDDDDGSLSSLHTDGKTSDRKDIKSVFDGRSESPVDDKHQELERSQELDPAAARSIALRFQHGEAYEVRGSAGFVLHQIGQCMPCLYHTRKADGCHKGDNCDHCHFCTKREAKTRRNRIQLEAHKAQRRASRASGNAAGESKGSDSQAHLAVAEEWQRHTAHTVRTQAELWFLPQLQPSKASF